MQRRSRLVSLLAGTAALGGAPLHAQSLPDNIDISGSPNGVVPLPGSVHPVFTNVFDRYTKIVAPNGQAIHLLLQDQVTDEMAVRAREVMRFYLTDVPGSEYGDDKTAIANSMGNLEATLVYFNTELDAFQAFSGPLGNADIFAQDLYATESVVEGTSAYAHNTNRDATLEEVFHLVHGAGIFPVLPAYHTEITNATIAAFNADLYNPPGDLPVLDYPFEYIISVIDVYYGYWAHDPSGNGISFFGEYAFHDRPTVEAGDPAGVTAMRKFLPEFFTADLTCAANFNGTFSLAFDPGEEYTHKSQYLTRFRLGGSNASSIVGNALDNVLQGNSAGNTLAGGDGIDTAVFSGLAAEYLIECGPGGVTVEDTVPGRDGTDTIDSIELLQFSDQTISSGVSAVEAIRAGTPANPEALLPGQTSGPVIGGVWDPVIDHATFTPDATLDVCLISLTPENLFLPGLGTLLCSLPTAIDPLSAAPGVPFAIAVPDNCNLVGLTVCAGGVSAHPAGAAFTNAIDATIGAY